MSAADRAALCAFSLACLVACGPTPIGLTPGAPPARVRFVPPSGSESAVTVTATPTGVGEFTCTAPCSMYLPAGRYLLEVASLNRGGFFASEVPSGDSVATVHMQNRSMARAGGITALTGGGVATIGVSLMAVSFVGGLVASGLGVVVGIPGFVVWMAAGSNGVAYEPAPAGTFRGEASLRALPNEYGRAASELAPTLPYARWSF